MKRLFALALAVLMISLVFCACGNKEFECDLCRKTKSGKSHVVEAEGEKATLCEDCKAKWDKLIDAVGNMDLSGLGDTIDGLKDSIGDLDDLEDSLGGLEDSLGDAAGEIGNVIGDLIG